MKDTRPFNVEELVKQMKNAKIAMESAGEVVVEATIEATTVEAMSLVVQAAMDAARRRAIGQNEEELMQDVMKVAISEVKSTFDSRGLYFNEEQQEEFNAFMESSLRDQIIPMLGMMVAKDCMDDGEQEETEDEPYPCT